MSGICVAAGYFEAHDSAIPAAKAHGAMINLLKALVILVLLGAIGGGAFGAYYVLVKRPRLRDEAERAATAAVPAGQPTPDPSTPDFEKLQALRREGDSAEVRGAIEAFMVRYPDSSHHDETENMLGSLNVAELFSGRPGVNKTEYVVQRGDVLDRVAHKTRSDPEFIYQANNLEKIILRIGQKLEIPQVDFSIEAHLASKKLVLLEHGNFFKSYPLMDARPLSRKTSELHSKVQEKIAFRDGRRVIFGSREYGGSLRSLTLAGQPGYTIYGQSDGSPGMGPEKPPGSGLALDPSDAEELHSLVGVGTPVTISAK